MKVKVKMKAKFGKFRTMWDDDGAMGIIGALSCHIFGGIIGMLGPCFSCFGICSCCGQVCAVPAAFLGGLGGTLCDTIGGIIAVIIASSGGTITSITSYFR